MEDFIGMIAIMIIYIAVAAVEGKKKRKQKARRSHPAGQRRMRSETAEPAPRASVSAAADSPSETAESVSAGFQEAFEENCADRPIHLHDVPQSVMLSAEEGDDPCHAGGSGVRKPAEAYEPTQDDGDGEHEALEQDMLRGVIMSEILTRPCERRAAERNRRGYHG